MTPFLVKYGKKLFGGKQTPGDLNHKALQAIKGGDLQGAIRLLTRAVGIDPDYLTGWYNLAQVQRQAGQIELSVRSLQRVLDRDASYPDAWTSQGNSYMALQKLQEARRCFRKAVEINRNDLRAWHNLSVAAGRLSYANEVKEARAEEARLAHADPQPVARALEEDRDGRIPVRTPTSGDPLSSHRLIGASQSVGVNAETVIPPGISVVFFKAEHGLFLIGVEDFQLEKMIQDNAVKSMLRKASSMFDRVILGEILQNYEDAADYTATPATTDPELRAWVDKIAKQFWTIIDGFRRWPSFTDFLMADNLYNPITTDYGHQIPLDYWWLTGNVAPRRGIHHASCCPDGIGVFVYPQTGLLPVFTSALYGDIIAQEIRSKLGVDLV
jgi:tetratricopeptide (TPR) repeat protein